MELNWTAIRAKLPLHLWQWPEAYRQLGMSPKRYVLQVVLPLGLLAVFLPWMVISYINKLTVISNLPRTSIFIALFLVSLIPIYPFLWKEAQMRKAEKKLPTLLTQMAILSTSSASAVKIIERISTMAEYDPLISTMKWVNMLVHRFHLPASDALQKVAKETSNLKVREFLERFSHAVEVGESPNRFLTNEQDVAMDEYSSQYLSSLSEVDGLKDSLASMITAALFLTTFLMLVPILTSINVTQMMMLVIMVFFMIEAFNAFVVMGKMPVDELWYKKGSEESRQFPFPVTKYVQGVMALGLVLVAVLANFLMPLNLPAYVKITLAITPLLLPGLIISIEESRIRDREENFAPFMRSLGRAGELKGESFVGNLRRLSLHEFGYLNDAIRRLTRRLSTRIKPVNAWRHFSAETGSNIINRYSEMYVQGTEDGGNPRECATLIDINLVTTLELRQERNRLASAMSGLFYGLMVAISFTLYINLNLLGMMGEQLAAVELSSDAQLSNSFLNNLSNLKPMTTLLTFMVTSVVFIHALISSWIIARLKGGHQATGYVNFVGLLWCGTITAFLTNAAISNLL